MTDFPTRLPYAQAQAIVDDVARRVPMPVEQVALSEAIGRIATEDVVATIDLPSFDNSAMDGFAYRHADLRLASTTGLAIVGTQFAGRDARLAVGEGEAVRITTGAALPSGADSVVMREMTQVVGARLVIDGQARQGTHIRHEGEDVRVGAVIVRSGSVLTATRLGLVASVGQHRVAVSRRPTVAVFTTGDELVEAGLPLQRGEIYNSNRTLLMGLLRAEGLQPMAWPTLPDDRVRMAAALQDAASSFDLVITCGAVSAGEKDFIPGLLQSDGGVHFWKVLMKPGMPLLFGRMGNAHVLGLPGNPVSVLATWLTLGRTLVDGVQGRTEPRQRWFAQLSAPFEKRHERREFLRGRLQPGDDGLLRVAPEPADGSHRLAAAAHSDVLIVLPEDAGLFDVGAVVEVLPY